MNAEQHNTTPRVADEPMPHQAPQGAEAAEPAPLPPELIARIAVWEAASGYGHEVSRRHRKEARRMAAMDPETFNRVVVRTGALAMRPYEA